MVFFSRCKVTPASANAKYPFFSIFWHDTGYTISQNTIKWLSPGRNISNGQISVYAPGEDISLLPGLYDVSYEAAVTLDNDAVASLRALKSSVVVSTPQILRLDAYCIVDTE